MGLGLLGRGLGDIKFLSQCGADLIVTDLKPAKELKFSLLKLKKFKNIKYVLGRHRLEDFRNRDMVLKAAGVPLNSAYIAEARKRKIPIEMSASLFAKLAPKIKIVGVTGTRGKSTVTHLIYEILKKSGQRVILGGNVKGVSTLALLPKIKTGDILVLELDSWQLQGFGESKISPHISVFTTFLPDHLNYYGGSLNKYFKDKANIFKFQTAEDYLVLSESAARELKARSKEKIQSKVIIAKGEILPPNLSLKIPGAHNRLNAALAFSVSKILKIPENQTRKIISEFKGVPGRLEKLCAFRGVNIYNDTTSTTPDAVEAALKALSKNKNLILIMGGADKKLNFTDVLKILPRYVKAIVLLPGTGSNIIRPALKKIKNFEVREVSNLKTALIASLKIAKKGDSIVFSPGFASFGMFKNEFDRGEQFVKLVKNLK